MTDEVIPSSRVCPSMRTSWMTLGRAKRRTPTSAAFSTIAIRTSLKPPLVEPAQAPQNASSISRIRQNCGQASKSSVANPAVVMMQVTWKRLSRRASTGPP